MKIAVVAANGRVAGKVITEAVNRGFEVTAFGRKENNTDAKDYVQKDLFDLTAEDLKGFPARIPVFSLLAARAAFMLIPNIPRRFLTVLISRMRSSLWRRLWRRLSPSFVSARM